MAHPTKIATCCFCGNRTMLKPTARKGHELACASCGAPLHNMKWLKAPQSATPSTSAKPAKLAKIHTKSQKPKRRRKSVLRGIFEEVWDIAEDIFD